SWVPVHPGSAHEGVARRHGGRLALKGSGKDRDRESFFRLMDWRGLPRPGRSGPAAGPGVFRRVCSLSRQPELSFRGPLGEWLAPTSLWQPVSFDWVDPLPASSLDRPNLVRTSDRVSAVQTPAQDNVVSTSHGAVPHDLGTIVPIAAKREADPLLVTAGTQGRGANGASDIITVRGDRWGEYSTTKGVTRVQENPRGNFERLRAYVSSSVPRPGSITEERIHGQAGVNLIYIADRSYETPEAF